MFIKSLLYLKQMKRDISFRMTTILKTNISKLHYTKAFYSLDEVCVTKKSSLCIG